MSKQRNLQKVKLDEYFNSLVNDADCWKNLRKDYKQYWLPHPSVETIHNSFHFQLLHFIFNLNTVKVFLIYINLLSAFVWSTWYTLKFTEILKNTKLEDNFRSRMITRWRWSRYNYSFTSKVAKRRDTEDRSKTD
jgi:hypothetical protein